MFALLMLLSTTNIKAENSNQKRKLHFSLQYTLLLFTSSFFHPPYFSLFLHTSNIAGKSWYDSLDWCCINIFISNNNVKFVRNWHLASPGSAPSNRRLIFNKHVTSLWLWRCIFIQVSWANPNFDARLSAVWTEWNGVSRNKYN